MLPETGHELLTTNRKALTINLDEDRYGTFAGIGAGQDEGVVPVIRDQGLFGFWK